MGGYWNRMCSGLCGGQMMTLIKTVCFVLLAVLTAFDGPPCPPGWNTNSVRTNGFRVARIIPTNASVTFSWGYQNSATNVHFRIFLSTNLNSWEQVDDVIEQSYTFNWTLPGAYFVKVAATQDLPLP